MHLLCVSVEPVNQDGHVPLTYAIELASKNLEYYQCEAELTETGADIGSFESALCSTDLNKFFGRQDHRACAM